MYKLSNQILLNERETNTGYKALKEKLIPLTPFIPAGCVMVFMHKSRWGTETGQVFFELLLSFKVEDLDHNSLMYYEPGSIVTLGLHHSERTPTTFLFENCRFPTVKELEYYEENSRL